MDYLRQIEDDLRNLGVETKRYPEIKDATERALATLKTIRELYISDMRKNTETNPCLSQSNDVSAPYILLCNYADATPKLINMALNGIQMLLNYEVVPPSDIKNILRVLAIQASASRTEFQLKILQILLLMANSLSSSASRSKYLTEATVCSFISQCLKMSRDSRSSVSISSTALSTTRQIATLVMDSAAASILSSSNTDTSESSLSAQRLVRDLTLFSRGMPGEWIKGISSPPSFALDLLHDLLTEWGHLFRTVPQFEALLFDCVCPSVKTLLRNLQEDYLAGAVRAGMPAAAALTTRVLRVARLLLLEFASLSPRMLGEVDLLVTLMLHSMQPYRGDSDGSSSSGDGPVSTAGSATAQIRSQLVGLIGMGFGMGATPSSSASTRRSGDDSSSSSILSPALAGGFLVLGRPGGTFDAGGNGHGRIPAHPVGCCLEALLSFFLVCGEQGEELQGQEGLAWTSFVSSAMINVVMSASAVVTGGLALDSALLDLKRGGRGAAGDRLVSLMEGYLAGGQRIGGGESSADLKQLLRALHEYPFLIPTPLGPSEVILLAFFLTQVITRLMLKCSLTLCAPALSYGSAIEPATVSRKSGQSTNNSPCERVQLFVSTSSLARVTSTSPHMQAAMERVCDSVFEPVEECCAAVLNALSLLSASQAEEPGSLALTAGQSESGKPNSPVGMQSRCSWLISRRAIGVLSELGLSAGFLGLGRACSSALSTVSRNSVPRWDGTQQLRQKHLADDTSSSRLQGLWSKANWSASVRLLQLVHVLADFIPDWDLVVHALEQLSCLGGGAHDHPIASSFSGSQQRQSSSSMLDWIQPSHSTEDPPSHEPDVPSPAEAEEVFMAIGRFKEYTCLMSDEALVRLMTSLVTLSLNSYGAAASQFPHTSSFSSNLNYSNSMGSNDVGDKNSGSSNNGNSYSSSGVTAKGARHPQGPNKTHSLPYLQDGINQGAIVNYSFRTVIEVTKLNSFRASCIWQMVTSHLRIMASMKNSGIRFLSVAATLDIVKCTLRECNEVGGKAPESTAGTRTEDDSLPLPPAQEALLSDRCIFHGILPPPSSILCPHPIHAHQSSCNSPSRQPQSVADWGRAESMLSPHDVLHALNSLAVVRYDDVRTDIISGLLELLQGIGGEVGFEAGTGGDSSSSGWTAILDLLHLVPASMTTVSPIPLPLPRSDTPSPPGFDLSVTGALEGERELDSGVPVAEPEWPRASLITAFRVIKLVADEFLESMELSVIGQVIRCLSAFAAQTADVNISLTSVEMLWKVSDVAMSPPVSSSAVSVGVGSAASVPIGASAGGFEIFQMMLGCLEDLSLDPRPEVRKSSVNTLFSSLTAHAASNLLSPLQLRTACEHSVFPLFQLQLKSEICRQAFTGSNREEAASAPELKKGIKMNVHHSRDTANKQWSETRTLSLRGLSRLLRTITRSLLLESDSWFKAEIWTKALELSHVSIETVGGSTSENSNTEISLAAIDLLFAMLKTVSTPPAPSSTAAVLKAGATAWAGAAADLDKAKVREPVDDMVAERESARDDLWQCTWQALKEAVGVRCLTAELALHMCQSLSGLYTSSCDAEFRYSANIQILLEMVVVLSRPRLSDADLTPDRRPSVPSSSVSSRSSVTEIQLQRAVIALLKGIKAVDCLAFLSLVSCLSELCFSFQPVFLPAQGAYSKSTNSTIALGPCAENLRMAAGRYLLDILQASMNDREGLKPGSSSVEERDRDDPGVVVPVMSKGSALSALDVVVKRFHYDICEAAMTARTARSDQVKGLCNRSRAESVSTLVVGATSDSSSSSSSSSGVWFLSSLGRMLSNSSDLGASPPYPASSSSSSARSPSRRMSMTAPMHKFQHAPSTHAPKGFPLSTRFRPLFDLTFEMDLLMRAIEVCFLISEEDNLSQQQAPSSSSGQRHPHQSLSVSTRSASVSLSLWSSLLSVVACCLSPWTDAELSPLGATGGYSPPPNSLPAQGSGAVGNMLRALFLPQEGSRRRSASLIVGLSKEKECATSPSPTGAIPWRLPLLDVCGASGVLLVHALLSDTGHASSFSALRDVLGSVWDQMIVIVRYETANTSHRKKALCGCLDILKSFVEGIMRRLGAESARAGAVAEADLQLCNLCAHFIDDFSALDTPPSVQLSATSVTPHPASKPSGNSIMSEEDDSALNEWLLSCQYSSLESSLAQAALLPSQTEGEKERERGESHRPQVPASKLPHTARERSGVDDKIAETRARSHLLLALPCILSLVSLSRHDSGGDSNCSSAQGIQCLRAAACRAVSRVDMTALMEAYTGLEERAKQLQAENVHLLSELNSISTNAASLPF